MQLELSRQDSIPQTASSRFRDLSQREIGFIHNPEFEGLDLEEVLAQPPSDLGHSETAAPGALLSPSEEQELFRRYNYLKFQANVLRSRLTNEACSAALLDRIEDLLNEVERLREQLVGANVRLVASIARKYSRNEHEFDDLYAEASVVLLNAVEKFDYSRGFRFSTYATHSIQRHLFRVLQRRQRRSRRERASHEHMACIPDRDDAPYVDEDTLQQFARLWEQSDEHLSRRDRFIISQRFGLGESQRSKTLKEIAAEVGLSKERVRQIQMRALERLRDLAEQQGLSIEL